MKKTIALLLLIVMVIGVITPYAAAAENVVWTKNHTITNKFNDYGTVVIKSGVTVSFAGRAGEPNGITIFDGITVEPGGTINGEGLIIFKPQAKVEGLELYYMAEGSEHLLKVSIEEFVSLFGADDYCPTFAYKSATGHWVLEGEFEHDPYAEPDMPAGPEDDHQQLGDRLRTLGLFQGVRIREDGTVDYELNRPVTRVEAVVILIRLLGKENEALSEERYCPFDDVPKWAKNYIGYAYETKLTDGISETKFGTGDATGEQFMTFVLRAKGFSDKDGDFVWSAPQSLAEETAVMPRRGSLEAFTRADALEVCESAVRMADKDGTPLFRKLIDAGVFTQEQYDAFLSSEK